MKRTLLSMGVVALLAANTYGAGDVWYGAVPVSGDGSVASGGAAGQQLVLNCTVPSSWDITVTYSLADGGATGWALDHYRNSGALSVSNMTVPSQGFGSTISLGTTPNLGSDLALDQSGTNSAAGGTGPGNFILMQFRLNAASCNGDVFAGIGGVDFGGNDPDGFDSWEVVRIGSNSPRVGFSFGQGYPDAAEPLPVIRVTPEPSTLALLALSGLALIRRRK